MHACRSTLEDPTVYQISAKETYTVRHDGSRLSIQRSGGRPQEVSPLSPTQFFYDKDALDRLTFARDAAGKVTGLKVTRRFGPPTAAARTDKPLPKARTEVKLAPEVLERYVGVYEMSPVRTMAVTRKGERLYGQPTGQPELELFAEAEGKFFLKDVDVQIEFQTDAAGKVTGLTMHQGVRVISAPKVK